MIKKFKAPTMMQAMKLAKEYFGENAVILQSKKVKEGDSFDSKSDELVEITATSDEKYASSSQVSKASKSFYSPSSVRKIRNIPQDQYGAEIKAELNGLKEAITDMSGYLRYNKMLLLPEVLHFLVEEKGMEEDMAAALLQKIFFTVQGPDLKNELKIKQALGLEISKYLNINDNLDLPENKPKTICLVGPTGMGKTTTIIKLATHPDFYGKNRVALITIDTYRVAAAAQLKTFAALAKLPLEIVYEPAEFGLAIERFKNSEVILIDTAGRSPLNSRHLEDLKNFFEKGRPDEIHLVLSISTRTDNLLDAVKNFAALSVNRVIISKIDETPRLGNIVNVASKISLPISFLTNGQSVPDDILLADKNNIANIIVGLS
ncbi:MAG: flagellar biosynthesis protein FlhF [bacterium]